MINIRSILELSWRPLQYERNTTSAISMRTKKSKTFMKTSRKHLLSKHQHDIKKKTTTIILSS